jgi:hypothetical protein
MELHLGVSIDMKELQKRGETLVELLQYMRSWRESWEAALMPGFLRENSEEAKS